MKFAPKSLFYSIVRLFVLQFARVQLGSVDIFMHTEARLCVAGIEGFCLYRVLSSIFELNFIHAYLLFNALTLLNGSWRELAGTSTLTLFLKHANAPLNFLVRIRES